MDTSPQLYEQGQSPTAFPPFDAPRSPLVDAAALGYQAHDMLGGAGFGAGGGGRDCGGFNPLSMYDQGSPSRDNSPFILHSPPNAGMLHSPYNSPMHLHSPAQHSDGAAEEHTGLPPLELNSPQFYEGSMLPPSVLPLLSRPAHERREAVRTATLFFEQHDQHLHDQDRHEEAMADDTEERKEAPHPAVRPPPPPPPPSGHQPQPPRLTPAPPTPVWLFTPAMPPPVPVPGGGAGMLPSPLHAPLFWHHVAAMQFQFQAAAAISAAAIVSGSRQSPSRVAAGGASPNKFAQASANLFNPPRPGQMNRGVTFPVSSILPLSSMFPSAPGTPSAAAAMMAGSPASVLRATPTSAVGRTMATPAVVVSGSQVVMAAAMTSGVTGGRRALFTTPPAAQTRLEPFGMGESVRFSHGVLLKLLASGHEAAANTAELLPSGTPLRLYQPVEPDRIAECAGRLKFLFGNPALRALFRRLQSAEEQLLQKVAFLATVTAKASVHLFQLPPQCTLLLWRPYADDAREAQGRDPTCAVLRIKLRTWTAVSALTSSAVEAIITSVLGKTRKTKPPNNARFHNPSDVAGWVASHGVNMLLPSASETWSSQDDAGWIKLMPAPQARIVAVCLHPEVRPGAGPPGATTTTSASSRKRKTNAGKAATPAAAAAASSVGSSLPGTTKQPVEHFVMILPPEICVD